MSQSEPITQEPTNKILEGRKGVPLDALRTLFNPRSIGIVGASSSTSTAYSMTTTPLIYLLKNNYQGKLFPINPKYQEVMGLKCYPSLSAVPEEIDVALLLVPAKNVLEVLEDCGRKGVRGVIVISAGFAEIGAEGRARQDQMKLLAERHGFILLGPNCVGLVNVIKRIPISFSWALGAEGLKAGRIGFASQSGALLSGIVSRAKEWGGGFSYLVGTGNEAHLDLVDCLRFMVEDPGTEVVMALIEGIRDPQKFIAVAELALKKRKPIVALKIGSSESGVRSAASHTGSIAGSFSVCKGIFKQKGIIMSNEVNDLILSARTFVQAPLPEGEGIGVVTTSGGGAGLISDLIHQEGLQLGNLSTQSIQSLSSFIRWYSTPQNPFDLAAQFIGDSSFAKRVYEVFLQDPDIHILLLNIIPVPQYENILIGDLIEAGKRFKKPVAVLYFGSRTDCTTEELINKEDLPFFFSAPECIKALGNLIRYSRYLKRNQGYRDLPFRKTGKGKALSSLKRKPHITGMDRKRILSFYGIRSARGKVVASAKEAVSVADFLGYPVALKVECPEILHKSEVMGVELYIHNRSELKQAYQRILTRIREALPHITNLRFLVQEMIVDHVAEVIVGAIQDPQFGPTVMFGLGGTMVETVQDVCFRMCPLDVSDIKEMIQEVKGYRILTGFRGKPKADIAALEETILRLSRLATDFRETIQEIEINPLMVLPEKEGVVAVDTLLIPVHSW